MDDHERREKTTSSAAEAEGKKPSVSGAEEWLHYMSPLVSQNASFLIVAYHACATVKA